MIAGLDRARVWSARFSRALHLGRSLMVSSTSKDGDARRVRLEVIAHTFQGMGICTVCEMVMADAQLGQRPTERALDEYPPEWQEEWRRLTEWVYDLIEHHGDRITIKVIDPQSPEGLFKSLRYRVRRYPTWVVDGRTRVVGWDREALNAALTGP
jgi:hypothetical protein